MGSIGVIGLFSIILGLILLIRRIRSRGEMDIEIGRFKGPVWFLLIIFGFFLLMLDAILPG
jgi:hypothetical protein